MNTLPTALRRACAAALALLCLAVPGAAALTGSGYPGYAAAPELNTFCGVIDGAPIRIGFNPLYVTDDEGRLLLDFLVCDDDGNCLDLYVTVPFGLRAGDVLRFEGAADDSPDFGVALVELSFEGERVYRAGLGEPGTLRMSVSAASYGGNVIRLSAALDATLQGDDGTAVTIADGFLDIRLEKEFPNEDGADDWDGGAADFVGDPLPSGSFRT